MRGRPDVRRVFSWGLLALLAMALLGCTAGVPQAEVDSLNRQLAAQQRKVRALEEKLAGKERRAAGATVLLAAVRETVPVTMPTPTPGPWRALPPSYAAPVAIYICADTVVGCGSRYGIDPTSEAARPCGAISSILKQGMRVTFRFEAIDTSSGTRLSDAEVKTAAVRLPDGEELPASFGRQGSADDAPWLWAATWDIPPEYPLGPLDWRIELTTKDGRTGSFRQFQVYDPEGRSDSRTQIVE